eukprot:tig00000204_g17700.t1
MSELTLSVDAASVYIYAAGGAFNVSALPNDVNGGRYRLRVYNEYGDGAYSPAFEIEPWALMEIRRPAAGMQVQVNTSTIISWSSALWSFEASVYLLPSDRDRVSSWVGAHLGRVLVSADGGSTTVFIPKETTPGDFVIQVVDGANRAKSCQMIPFVTVIAPDEMWEPVIHSVSGTNGTRVSLSIRYWRGQNASAVEVNCTGDARMYMTSTPVRERDPPVLEAYVPVEPSYTAGFYLNCSVCLRSTANRVSPSVDVASVWVNPASQNVTLIEVACTGPCGMQVARVAASDVKADGIGVEMNVAPSFASTCVLVCSASAITVANTHNASVSVLLSMPLAPPSAPLVLAASATNATHVSLQAAFAAGQNVTAIQFDCAGFGGPYRRNVSVSDLNAAGFMTHIVVAASYGGNYTLACSVAALSAAGLWSSTETTRLVVVPAETPSAPTIVAVDVVNSTLLVLQVAFTGGQNVTIIEASCTGSGGAYVSSAAVTDAEAGGAGVGLSVAAPLSYMNYTLSCVATAESATSLRATSGATLATIPAGSFGRAFVRWPPPPSAPLVLAASATNATHVSLQAAFAAGQNVTAIQFDCAGFGGPYRRNVSVSDLNAAGFMTHIVVAASYGGNYTLACSVAALSAAGLWSSTETTRLVVVPAETPSAPTIVAVDVVNSTLLVLQVAFTGGQNVTIIEASCTGSGGAYVSSAAVADAEAGGAGVGLPVAAPLSYMNYTLSCVATAESATSLRATSGATLASIPAGSFGRAFVRWPPPPSAPLVLAASATNATHVSLQAAFAAGQNVTAIQFDCAGFGGPYRRNVSVSDLNAAGFMTHIVAAASYGGNYTLACSVAALSAAGLWSSTETTRLVVVPAETPSAPTIVAVDVVNSTLLVLQVAFTGGQNVTIIEASCTGSGGAYVSSAAVTDAEAGGAGVGLPVAAPLSYMNYTLSCVATAESATSLRATSGATLASIPAGSFGRAFVRWPRARIAG